MSTPWIEVWLASGMWTVIVGAICMHRSFVIRAGWLIVLSGIVIAVGCHNVVSSLTRLWMALHNVH